MKIITTSLIVLSAVCITCSPSKKGRTKPVAVSSPAPAPVEPPNSQATVMLPAPRANNGVFAPGPEQLAAIQIQYKDVTMATLSEGHALYTGVCTDCHKAVSIYAIPEFKWGPLIADMGLRARMNDAQKDAIYKYVLSVKKTQPSGN